MRASALPHRREGERQTAWLRLRQFTGRVGTCQVAGKTLIQTTTNGTAGINAARGADRIYAGALVTAEATVRAILRNTPAVITLVAERYQARAHAREG